MKTFAAILVIVGVLNFASFAIFCAKIGGSAANGEICNGHYFVREHTKTQEVSEQTFDSTCSTAGPS